MEVGLNDGVKWNANLGLVSDNNNCSGKAFMSISAFHLEFKLVFGNTFISQARQLNQRCLNRTT